MYILGLSCYYHDAAAALMKDDTTIAAAQEERFTRKKHDISFPENAIRYCLESQSITIDDIDHVVFYEKPILKFERFLSQSISGFPFTFRQFLRSTPSWLTEKLRIPKTMRKRLGYKGDIFFLDHHASHASSFLISPFKKAAIVSVDGVGEWTTTTYGKGDGTSVELLKSIDFPHSLGLLYSTITAYLGFSVNNSEYKVMGLAAHGTKDKKKNRFYRRLRNTVIMHDDGSFSLDMRYFSFHKKQQMPSRKLCELLGGPIRKKDDPLRRRHKEIAAALQALYEELLFNLLSKVHEETSMDDLVLSGGCALNSVANGKIISRTGFKRVWIPPDPGDGGNSIGAAAYAYAQILEKGRPKPLTEAFLGPTYNDRELKDFLDRNNISYHKLESDSGIIREATDLLISSRVIGWFQGGMEWGPRALGARSILSNPCDPNMQDILNTKVKHRETFRPFAPVVCENDAEKYFETDCPVPRPTDFMLMVYPIKEEFHDKIPAVTHIDGTGRLQTIRKHQHPLYYDLIKSFGERSGIPILINTSFNIRGEPIVCTPEDAYRCMMGTGIDALFIGNFLVYRDENKKDIWD
ncbi:MAG: carbamoyltransferase, partial [Candidatus Woesearchaeota archaeon]